MNPANILCSECERRTADFFCSCTYPETLLCEGDLLAHTRKVSRKEHQSWPIALLPYYQNPQYVERLKAFPTVSVEALGCIGQVESAIEKLNAKTEEIIKALRVLCAEKGRELREIQASLIRDIPAALKEVERTLAEERPALLTEYGPMIRKLTEKTGPLQLFRFSLETCSPLFVRFKLTTSQNLSTHIAGVFEDKAYQHSVATQQFTRQTLPVYFGVGGSYVGLDRDRLLCVGSELSSSAVYLLELPTFRLSLLPSLSTPRCAPGIAKVKGYVYVFGGSYNQIRLSSCEKMELSNNLWEPMRSMIYARNYFTPCLFRSLLYLASATESVRAVETFDPETEVFTVLPVSLPPQLTLQKASVAFITEGELCLLTAGEQMARWKIDTEQKFRLSDTKQTIWSNQLPLIVGSLVLIANFGGVVYFSLDTYSFITYLE